MEREPVWSVVVPVKGALGAKTRLGAELADEDRGALALAFARDTIEAALAAGVGPVVVVTGEPDSGVWAWAASYPRERLVLVADRGRDAPAGAGGGAAAPAARGGLAGAIGVGLAAARADRPYAGMAVLLGDLPALRPEALTEALGVAARHPGAFVPDAEGTGTALVTARPGAPFRHAFGEGSAAAHRALGLAELTGDGAWASLRRDVDTPAALVEARSLGVGPATRAALRGIRVAGAAG